DEIVDRTCPVDIVGHVKSDAMGLDVERCVEICLRDLQTESISPAGWLDRLRLREDVGRILICGLGPVRGRGSGATKLARGRCRSGSCSEREKAAPLNSSLGVLASRLRCELCGG